LKIVLQTIWKELSQEHINKAVANFTKRWTACVAAIVISNICSNSVRFQICITISSSTNWLFSKSSTDPPGRQRRQMGVPWL